MFSPEHPKPLIIYLGGWGGQSEPNSSCQQGSCNTKEVWATRGVSEGPAPCGMLGNQKAPRACPWPFSWGSEHSMWGHVRTRNSWAILRELLSVNRWTVKTAVACTYSGVLISHKREWISDTGYNVDEIWKWYSKWKESETKWQLRYNITYIKYLQKAKS